MSTLNLGSSNGNPKSISAGAATSPTIATAETTTSTSYTDLTTVTDTVTVVIGANGLALVNIFCGQMYNNTPNTAYSYMGFAVSGASTIAATDSKALLILCSSANVPQLGMGASFLVTGLTAGSTTFKLKYRVSAGTGGFANRSIGVVPL